MPELWGRGVVTVWARVFTMDISSDNFELGPCYVIPKQVSTGLREVSQYSEKVLFMTFSLLKVPTKMDV